MDHSKMPDEDLLHCSLTIPGWMGAFRQNLGCDAQPQSWVSLTKCTAEFAVRLIQDISWNPNAFKHLEIPATKKVVLALAEANMSQPSDAYFQWSPLLRW